MKAVSKRMTAAVLMTGAALWVLAAQGQTVLSEDRSGAGNLVVPQSRVFSTVRRDAPIEITEVRATICIADQLATTTMDVSLRNPSGVRQEAELVVPVPEGAIVRGFAFQGEGAEPSAQVLPKEEARRAYESIVAKVRDPALLEFLGCNLIRSSVFPVEAGGSQKVRLVYENLLEADGTRIDYMLPRSESLEFTVPWKLSVEISSGRAISTVYSPTHELLVTRRSDNELHVRLAPDAAKEPGPFLLSYLLQRGAVSASLLAYPDAKANGGYFLLLAGLPARIEPHAMMKREVTLVLDRSGSMRGEKVEQVREAAIQIVAGLLEGERFNILSYNETVDFFSKDPVAKTRESVQAAGAYLARIQAGGGTNIHDALLEALRQKPSEGMLPIVLFLTDGLPTVGKTSEVEISDPAAKANPFSRRVFTFGVGVDVNAPLLDKIARETRARSTYVLPKEDVEVKVAQVFKRLAGPVLSDTHVAVADAQGKPAPSRTSDFVPGKLPDLFEGDQLVLLGRYSGEEPLRFQISGKFLGVDSSFTFSFDLERATTKNAFVPRLWASRKIAALIDGIRALGADGDPVEAEAAAARDPRVRELVDEIVRLSTQFGILTEYTAFLAREGTDLSDVERVNSIAASNFEGRAIRTRVGLAAVNQSLNNEAQFFQSALNRRNDFYDADMNRVSIETVQQVNDLAFYRRQGRWVDSRLVGRGTSIKPAKTIAFASAEFRELAARLAADNRQGAIALAGDILLEIDGETVLVTGPEVQEGFSGRSGR